MNSKHSLNFLCISTFFKGEAFLRTCHQLGNKVYLLTDKKLEHDPWPRECLEDIFYIDIDKKGTWNQEYVVNGLAYKFRSIKFDRFVALDDFDVEKAAFLREYFRMPGMGETIARFFRDKLAMRLKAQEENIPIPQFTALFHDADINRFADTVPAPWLIKPRTEASATGIRKIYSKEALWSLINELGDERHKYLLERFAPGTVYHVDSLTFDSKVVFSKASRYLDTPFNVAHGGGIFRSCSLPDQDEDAKKLLELNKKVLVQFGITHSASHTEFIKSNDTGEFFFLETSSRVGGANLAEMVEMATGINLWAEWARLEDAKKRGLDYKVPKRKELAAGIVVSLCRYEYPDMSSFNEPELVWKMNKKWHIGLIVQSEKYERVLELLESYTGRIASEYHASLPAPDRPTN